MKSKDKSFGIGIYGSVRFMLPLGGRHWQLFVGPGLNAHTDYRESSYSNSLYDYTYSANTRSRSYYAEIVPQIGLLYYPHPRILVDVTFARFLGAQIASYSWMTSSRVEDRVYDYPDYAPYYPTDHSESKQKSTSFNRLYADKLHLIDDLQFGISYLF